MRTHVVTVAFVVICIVAGVAGRVQTERVISEVYGGGSASCEVWTKRQSGNPDVGWAFAQSWVLGFVSGASIGEPQLAGHSAAELIDRIDDYCAANPERSLAEASLALVEDLSSGP